MLFSILRTSPLLQSICATCGVVAVIFGGVLWLRVDAKRQAVAQCSFERELAETAEDLRKQTLINVAIRADSARAIELLKLREEQLLASENDIQAIKEVADAWRDAANKNDPKSSDVVFDRGDRWLRARAGAAGGPR